MEAYKKRVADRLLADKLDAFGAVLVEGPKYCGKTTMSKQLAKSAVYLANPEDRQQNLILAQTNPARLLQGETPRLIDEWQLVPELWDSVRGEIDSRDEDGQFILTGSAVPADSDKIFHSGAGRFAWLKLMTMSLWESGESTGQVSLKNLFENSDTIDGESKMDLDSLAYVTCRGGWPKAVIKKRKASALAQAFEYLEAIVRNDLTRVDKVGKNEDLTRRLLRSYARLQGSQASAKTILDDLNTNGNQSLSENTLYSYLKALKKIFVIEDSVAWNPNLRSKTSIRTSDTHYYTDPSIATAALGLGPEDLINDLETFGLIFETLCVRDLRVYAEASNGKVYHYRDKTGLECDAVVHLRNGKYGLIEVKLGGDRLIEDGAENLLKLQNKIDTSKMKDPSFLMVLTGVGQYAYRRKDGVLIVPIGCLKD